MTESFPLIALFDRKGERSMSNETPDQTQRSSGPTIIQAFIWGFVAAAFGSLFAFIGSLLSEKPDLPPEADALHGASTPAEMNRVVDTLLAAGQTAIDPQGSPHFNAIIGDVRVI